MYKLIERLYDKKIDASGLAAFRIGYSLVLLCEVIQLYYFRHLIFDKIPFVEPGEIDLSYALIGWMITLMCLALGLFTRTAAIINYLLSLVFIATINSYEYHMFYVYMGVNFLLVFINTTQVNSIDRLILKLKHSTSRGHFVPSRVSPVLNYYVVLLVAVAFVYIDSIFFKITSHNWMQGLGMWLPASLSYMTHIDVSTILNIKWIALGLGYLTVVFEAVFLFVFFRKRWRVPLLIIGLGLHIGIFIIFPIPWFGLGVAAIYMLMVPVSWWQKLRSRVQFKKASLTFFYDEECPLCYRVVIILKHFDLFKAIEFKGLQSGGFSQKELLAYKQEELLADVFSITQNGKVLKGIDTYVFALKRIPSLFILGIFISIPGLYHLAKVVYQRIAVNRFVERCTDDTCGFVPLAVPEDVDKIKILHGLTIKKIRLNLVLIGLIVLVLLQANVSYNSPLFLEFRKTAGVLNSPFEKVINHVASPAKYFSKIFFGITSHPVFMDSHFNRYEHVIALEVMDHHGNTHWLPIIDTEGHAGSYAYGPMFVKWTFRVNSQDINQSNLESGIRDFVTFWSVKNGFSLSDITCVIYSKPIATPTAWERDFLEKQKQNQWQKIGTAAWVADKTFVVNISTLE